MKAILKSFDIPLSKKQASEIKAQKRGVNVQGYGIICQPVTSWGPFEVQNCVLQCVVLSPEAMEAIALILKGGQ